MPDCLTTTAASSPDIGVLCVANAIAHLANARPDIPADVARAMAQHAADLRDLAGVVRALGNQPSKVAADLIQCLAVATDLEGALWESRTTIRCLPPEDVGRVAAEVELIRARAVLVEREAMAR